MFIIKKAAIFFFVFILTLIYWEGVIRLISQKDYWTIVAGDPKIRMNHQKNYSGRIWITEENKYIYIRTTGQGFIGDDLPIEKSPDVFRIAFLGNSMVEGLQVDFYDSFIERLERALNTGTNCRNKIEVMNFGIGGMNVFEEYQVYRNYAAAFNPDLVILGFFDNNVENPAAANYDLDGYSPRFGELKSLVYRSELAKFLIKKFSGNTAIQKMMEKANIIKVRDINAGSTESARSNDKSGQKELLMPAYPYSFTAYVIKKLDEKVKSNNSDLIVLFFPLPQNDKSVNNPEKIHSLSVLSKELAAQKISVFDPSVEFTSIADKTGDCLYDRNCSGHLNDQGHQAIAKILFKYLSTGYLSKNNICK